ncbi:MAG: hypothetical protein R2912_09070 [Eubacteriales bacterium]
MDHLNNQVSEKKLNYRLFLESCCWLVLGLGLTLLSTSSAFSAASSLMNNNGSMDTTRTYEYIMSNTALSFSIVGAILALIAVLARGIGRDLPRPPEEIIKH